MIHIQDRGGERREASLLPSTNQKMSAPASNHGPATALLTISAIALFVIGCMAAAGTFRHSTAALGRTVVGLGATVAGLQLYRHFVNPDKMRGDWIMLATGIIAALGAITAGTLGMHGIASMKQIGWTIVGSAIAIAPFNCCASLDKFVASAEKNVRLSQSQLYN